MSALCHACCSPRAPRTQRSSIFEAPSSFPQVWVPSDSGTYIVARLIGPKPPEKGDKGPEYIVEIGKEVRLLAFHTRAITARFCFYSPRRMSSAVVVVARSSMTSDVVSIDRLAHLFCRPSSLSSAMIDRNQIPSPPTIPLRPADPLISAPSL